LKQEINCDILEMGDCRPMLARIQVQNSFKNSARPMSTSPMYAILDHHRHSHSSSVAYVGQLETLNVHIRYLVMERLHLARTCTRGDFGAWMA